MASHPDLGNIIKDSSKNRDILQAILTFTKNVIKLNQEVSGNIFHMKRTLLKIINGI